MVGGWLLFRWIERQPRKVQLRWGLYILGALILVVALVATARHPQWIISTLVFLLLFAKKIIALSFAPLFQYFVRKKTQTGGQGASASGTMTRAEAFDILGLKEGASRDEIIAAHKRLMQKFHPDRGGSDYLAKRINRAKDILLGETGA